MKKMIILAVVLLIASILDARIEEIATIKEFVANNPSEVLLLCDIDNTLACTHTDL